ncbi:hypothetical protein CGRA01v4_06386 [Colletotrichum graminicola]|nr:hypothetical protein CGRA01v4_06386 [Colletotrichum graminicola]
MTIITRPSELEKRALRMPSVPGQETSVPEESQAPASSCMGCIVLDGTAVYQYMP